MDKSYKFLILTILGGFAPMAGAAELIFKEDFESVRHVRLENNAELTTHAPYSGNFAARSNFFNKLRPDPFIKQGNSGATVITTHKGIIAANPEVLYITYKFRFDDALWRNAEGKPYAHGDGTPSDLAVTIKGGYYGYYGNIVSKGFYLVWRGGPRGELVFADNSSGEQPWNPNWEKESWASGTKAIYLHTGHPFGADGKWHTFEMEVDYRHPKYVRAKIWVDGRVAANERYTPASDDYYFRLPKGFKIEQFSTSYASTRDLWLSTHRTGYACGFQVDDIEVWNGNPRKVQAPPLPPGDLRVTVSSAP